MSVVLFYPFRRDAVTGAGVPIGLLYLATYLKTRGFGVSVVDLGGEERTDFEVVKDIIARQPLLVGVPVYTPQQKMVYDLLTVLREEGYTGKIVLGAQQATALPEETLRDFSQADYLLQHEAETTLTKLADYVVNNNGRLTDIENLYYRDGVIKHTLSNPDILKNLDELPIPDRSLLERYYKGGLYNRPYTKGDCDCMVTSRGCPYSCNFCFPSASKYRHRSVENVLKELFYLKGLGRKHVEIVDDTFTISKKVVEETLRAIADSGVNLSLKIRSRVDLIDTEVLQLMKAAGVTKIVYGVESGSDFMLRAMNKRATAAQNAKAIELTKKAGIDCFADIFIGYPGETPETVKETELFLRKTRPTGARVVVYFPLPMTVGLEEAKKSGLLTGEWSCLRDDQDPYVKLDWIESVEDLWRIAGRIKRRYYLHPLVLIQTSFFVIKNTRLTDLLRIFKYAILDLFPAIQLKKQFKPNKYQMRI